MRLKVLAISVLILAFSGCRFHSKGKAPLSADAGVDASDGSSDASADATSDK